MNHLFVTKMELNKTLCGAEYCREDRYFSVTWDIRWVDGPWCQKCLDHPELPLLLLAHTEL